MSQRTIGVTELVLRDAHQSLIAIRMAMEDMVEACEDIDKAGYWSVECWGGATYDACIRFLNEDPWERLRTFRCSIFTGRGPGRNSFFFFRNAFAGTVCQMSSLHDVELQILDGMPTTYRECQKICVNCI